MPIAPIAPYPLPREHELPADRVGWTPDPARAVLLVHDMQRYFVRAFAPDAEPLAPAIANIARLLAVARELDVPVLYSAQPGDQTPEDRRLLRDFWGDGPAATHDDIAIIDALAPRDGEEVLTKWRYSAFQRTDLRERVAALGRDQLLITGIYTHIGCLMTAAEAFMLDLQAFLVADATADFSREEHLMALRWASGRCARTVTAGQAVAQLRAAPVGAARG
jgi:bifunctional isochorismate lyase/aryl carrier protein